MPGPYTLLSVAAIVLGGVSLAGGRGGVFGPIIAVVVLQLIRTDLTFLDVDTNLATVAQGAILIGVVMFGSLVADATERADDRAAGTAAQPARPARPAGARCSATGRSSRCSACSVAARRRRSSCHARASSAPLGRRRSCGRRCRWRSSPAARPSRCSPAASTCRSAPSASMAGFVTATLATARRRRRDRHRARRGRDRRPRQRHRRRHVQGPPADHDPRHEPGRLGLTYANSSHGPDRRRRSGEIQWTRLGIAFD